MYTDNPAMYLLCLGKKRGIETIIYDPDPVLIRVQDPDPVLICVQDTDSV